MTLLFICGYCAVSFEDSMKTSYRYDEVFMNSDSHWQIFKADYDLYLQNYALSDEYIIPKQIHFIWLGSPLPQRCEEMVNSWKKFHPDWVVKIWTDDDIPDFHLRNQAAFDQAQNYGEKSDIFRYEILYRYGGLYVDTDFECIQPFDELHKSSEFYTGTTYDHSAILYNGLIGARPRHPILRACVENISISSGDNDPFRIMESTGPYYFAKMYFQVRLSEGCKDAVCFPVTHFYPLPNNVTPRTDHDWIKQTFLKPESMAIHYWDSSWAK